MKKIFAGNWKLNKNPSETRRFLHQLKSHEAQLDAELIVFPPATSWEASGSALLDSKITWGAQNVCSQGSGAFTGENSGVVLKDLGGKFVLVGHSERRHLFGESDTLLADKVAFVQALDLTPVLCVGETLPQREAQQTNEINRTQLQLGLAKADRTKRLIVAYEPVWAIGTGKVATEQQVVDAHDFVATFLQELGFSNAALLYGGSVKPDNSASLLKIPHVDGFLIGGASLDVETFVKIIRGH